MKKGSFICFFIMVLHSLTAQTLQVKIQRAIQRLESEPQMKHAMLGFSVADAKTGKIIIEHHSQTGLAPASCQKLFTSAAAFDLLGKDYRYPTLFGYNGNIKSRTLDGNLLVTGSGDPSLGSWRWKGTRAEYIFKELIDALHSAGIIEITGNLYINDTCFSLQPVPGGWIWEDIGNYYGAGSWGLNWHENQYDLALKGGDRVDDPVELLSIDPPLQGAELINRLKTGKKGSGDNSIIYLPPNGSTGVVEGTIPMGDPHFEVSGAMPYAPINFAKAFTQAMDSANISFRGAIHTGRDQWRHLSQWPAMTSTLLTHYSPPLDSLNYWFLKKSINLYGEILLKTMALKKYGAGSTDSGIAVLKDFWKRQGIEPSAIQIIDGSGLSPQNRVTTDALIKVLQYARTASWYNSFYESLPLINGMKMKSGSIGGARSFAGYQHSKDNKEYIFAIIVNNYDASSAAMVKKLWSLLDLLK